jgi:type IX secretion system PorP/SprF family membrane protein
MKKSFFSIFFFFCAFQFIYSQEDGVVSFAIPVRNSLKYNRFIINPTFSFVREQNSYATIYNKRQWVQFDNAPLTYFASYSGRFLENEGIGIGLFQQNYGLLTTFGGVVNFAHNVTLEEDSYLTFGLNAGFYKSGINRGAVVTNFPDPSLDKIPSNSLVTVSPGINYRMDHFDFGLAYNNAVLYNLKTSKLIPNDPEKSIQAHLMYTGFIETEGFFEFSKFVGLVKVEKKTEKTVVSGLALLNTPKGIWAQAGYNTQYGISAGLGLNITKNIALEYNFERGISNFSDFGFSHEITFAYKFKSENYDNIDEDEEESSILSSDGKKSTVAKVEKNSEKIKISPIDRQKLIEMKEALAAKKEEERLKEIADAKAKEIADAKAKVLADAKAKADATKAIADAKIKAEEDAKAKVLADAQAKIDADKAKVEAEQANARAIADAKIKAKADQEKAIADAKAKVEEEQANARAIADAKVKADAEKAIADAKVKADAEQANAKAIADAKVKADAEKAIADAKVKADAEQANAKAIADAKVKADAEKAIADAKAKADAEQANARAIADAKAKADAEKAIADAKAKADAEQANARAIADAKVKADAEKAIADAKAKADAELANARAIADAKAKAIADAKEKADAEKAIVDAKAKADAERANAEANAKAIADAKAKAIAEAKAEADAKALADAQAKADAQNALNVSNQAQNELLSKFRNAIDSKQKELAALKKKNDDFDNGIVNQTADAGPSLGGNKEMDNLKNQFTESIDNQKQQLEGLQRQYADGLRRAPNKNDPQNLAIQAKIEALQNELLRSEAASDNLNATIASIKAGFDIENKRRIRRAVSTTGQGRYDQDVATLNRIKETTKPSTTPLKAEDFDFGNEQSNMQIIKNVKNVESGYYLSIAVHTDVAKRDTFVTKAVQAGEKDVNFFYDDKSGSYFIYYSKFESLQEAQNALSTKGSKPYNGKMVLIRIENK